MNITSAPTSAYKDLLHLLHTLVEQEGPTLDEYKTLNQLADEVHTARKKNKVSAVDLFDFYRAFDDYMLDHTLIGHCMSKPYGCPGDFSIIDKIYRKSISEEYPNWDNYFHSLQFTEAIRNRKKYFKHILAQYDCPEKSTGLLHLNCGTVRGLFEYYEEKKGSNISADCMDMEDDAIDCSKELFSDHKEKVTFETSDIAKVDLTKKYDLIWVAGLFNYLEDEEFVLVLKKLISASRKGTEIIVGSFSPDNTSKGVMNILLDWPVQHRGEKKLIKLAKNAGVKKSKIKVNCDETGAYLFLHIHQ